MLPNTEKHLKIRGTQIGYYFICKTKLWFFSHNLQMEQESELVALGKQIHKGTYQREKKDQTIDSLISFDFIRKGDLLEVHEVKKSQKMEDAHEFQLLYYLYYLKKEKGLEDAIGVIDYPKIRKKKTIKLEPSLEMEIEKLSEDITSIVEGELPKPVKIPICRKCAYYELCWV
ncbi:MAG: CRISPR-associated protein Cas4 [Methanobacteriales archaeon Met13]